MQHVFLHGLGQSAATWNPVIKAMEEGKNVFNPRMMTWIKDKEPTVQNLYEGLEQYMWRFHEPVDLCGISLGGILAVRYALEHPEKVNSLALIGMQFMVPKKQLQVQNAFFKLVPGKVFQEMGLSKKEYIALTKSMAETDPDLSNLSCPVFFLCGQNDKTGLETAQRFHEKLSRSVLLTVEGVGYELNVEAPKQLAKILDSIY